MSEMSESRKCLKCGKAKQLNIGNFKKRKNAIEFSISCRLCLDSESARRYRERTIILEEARTLDCKNPKCNETFTGKRKGALFCSRQCRITYANNDKTMRRIKSMQENKNKKKVAIDTKWLIRGRIYGVDYR